MSLCALPGAPSYWDGSNRRTGSLASLCSTGAKESKWHIAERGQITGTGAYKTSRVSQADEGMNEHPN